MVARKALPFVSPRLGAVSLFFFLFGASLLLFHGQLMTSDEQLMAATSSSIAERFSLTFEREIHGQYFTGYGMGQPVAGVPAYLLDKALYAAGAMEHARYSVMPLTNAVLFALLGLLLASFLDGDRRWGAVALLLCASPFFPVSLTFYSEMLTAVGTAALLAGIWHDRDSKSPWCWALLGAVGALAATLARTASLPVLLLVLVWGWRNNATWRSLGAGAAGCIVGVAAWMMQNLALRGSILATGYEGQAFTTPLLTGLHGLLVSPERGLLIFYPLLLAVFFGWSALRGRGQALAMLGCAALLFSLVFHAVFWTWHGGWTLGPRFLLPVLVFFVPVLADLLARLGELGKPLRVFLVLALGWSAIMAYIYSRHAAIGWWNQLWGFHQQENQWLFLPQLSLWHAWFSGLPLPVPREGLGLAGHLISGVGFILCVLALYPLGVGWRGYHGTDPRARDADRRLFQPNIPAWVAFAGALFLALFVAVPLAKGPRGWQVTDTPSPMAGPRHMLLDGRSGVFEGWIDHPLNTPVKLAVRGNGLYRVEVDMQMVLEEMERGQVHLARAEVPLTRGLHHIRVTVFPGSPPPVFQLYWSWGGEGRHLMPAGGEYLLPRQLTVLESFATRIWRQRFVLAGAALALLLLFRLIPARQEAPGAGFP